ncbi:Homeo [Glarea lozoyensis ATCC 20868]|uniref:Homeo n=1 Tax=Glarea lozoyensis (strain ATCC 20868 / MF5171) TaxID=1116229 RepID=S3DGD0_GLAL2|nr:Homeo [Glarea lozoyensis ATCC 20868]EPE31081.1 Homeo [Glarea lozoyensis ATCC 20868]
MTDVLSEIEQDSASAYEVSESENASSDQEKNNRSRASSSNRARNGVKNAIRGLSTENKVGHQEESNLQSSPNPSSDERFQNEAREWATNFEPPKSAEDIRSPRRHGPHKKRKPSQVPPTEARVKRLRAYHNSEFRDVLNIDISDVVHRSIREKKDAFHKSQLGASIWTSSEKELFFAALERLGRADARGIAQRIRTKSTLEVHEYLRLLDEGGRGREEKDKSIPESELWLDMPAAFEVSEECCLLLERAGDALASHEQQHEEKVEKEKWGDCWLVNKAISQQLAKRNHDGEDEAWFREVLPAANLFDLRNWIKLSREVFMNPAFPREEENWQALAEAAEQPAIRATALEDFHSLAVNFTKRLISTTFFCTMSRQRAMSAKNNTHGDVTRDDVDAAIQILGIKPDSYEFWLKCPRRCNLSIIDPEESDSEGESLTYDEVEDSLRKSHRRRSRSRSRSHSLQPEHRSDSSTSSESTVDSGDETEHEHQHGSSHSSGNDATDVSDTNIPSRKEEAAKRALAKQEGEEAQERYIEAYDMDSSKIEEARLWTMLEQDPPFEMKVEPLEEPESSQRPRRGRQDMSATWRDRVQYWSPWETFDKPVPKESFEKNRNRVSKSARKLAERLNRKDDYVRADEDGEDDQSVLPDRPSSDDGMPDLPATRQDENEHEPMEEDSKIDQHHQPVESQSSDDSNSSREQARQEASEEGSESDAD